MTNLQKFSFEKNEVQTVLINEELYFVGKEISTILGYSNSRKALSDHVDPEDKLVLTSQNVTLENIPNRGLIGINESGLYSLVIGSKLPTAKKFKRWVTKEVLPSIRKNGMYATVPQLDPDASIELQMFDLLGKAMARQERATKELQVSTKRLEEKVENMEAQKVIEVQNAPVQEVLMLKRKLYTTQEIAEPFGFNGTGGVYRLNQLLHDKRIVYPTRKKNGKSGFVWKLYKKHQGKGYKDLSSVASSQKWTEEGKFFLESVLKSI